METRSKSRFLQSVLLAVICTLSVSLWTDSEEIGGLEPGELTEVQGVRLDRYGQPVAIMGHLTADGIPVPGTNFYLFYDPAMKKGCGESDLWDEHAFPEPALANGAMISYILYPNGLVSFSVNSSQFQPGYPYVLPFLPEDPPGAAAVKFF